MCRFFIFQQTNLPNLNGFLDYGGIVDNNGMKDRLAPWKDDLGYKRPKKAFMYIWAVKWQILCLHNKHAGCKHPQIKDESQHLNLTVIISVKSHVQEQTHLYGTVENVGEKAPSQVQ